MVVPASKVRRRRGVRGSLEGLEDGHIGLSRGGTTETCRSASVLRFLDMLRGWFGVRFKKRRSESLVKVYLQKRPVSQRGLNPPAWHSSRDSRLTRNSETRTKAVRSSFPSSCSERTLAAGASGAHALVDCRKRTSVEPEKDPGRKVANRERRSLDSPVNVRTDLEKAVERLQVVDVDGHGEEKWVEGKDQGLASCA